MTCRSSFTLLIAVVWAGLACQQPGEVRVTPEAAAAVAGLSPRISSDDFIAHVDYLAADECRGRLTGTPGARRAAEYIAAAFGQADLEPISKKTGYYQPFEFTAGVLVVQGANKMEVLPTADAATGGKNRPCTLDQDFSPLAFSGNGTAEGGLVFVGYGIVEPKSKGGGYDSYAGLEVADKVVLALRHLPEDITAERRQELSLYAGDRYKAKLAADRGAKAFLLVTGPNSPNPGKLLRLRRNSRIANVSIPAASISGELAERLLQLGGIDDLETLQSAHDGETFNPHVQRTLNGTRVHLAVNLERIRKTCRNVVGLLPPTGGETGYIIVGGHYDHLGTGEGPGSLARQGEIGRIHNGADDNASGTALVLELAAAIAEARGAEDQAGRAARRRGVIFACWSGEEIGIIGSAHFTNHPPVPLDDIKACFNFDMVGRLTDNKLIVQALGSSPAWPGLIERQGKDTDFDIITQDDPYLPTDAMSFYTKGVPILALFTGSHADYHRPTDDADKLDYDGLERVAAFAGRLVEETAGSDMEIAYARVERAAPARARGGVRAFTGTIPDYAGGDIQGVLLSDVRPNGPAAKAGIKGGDVIVDFAGQKINNLQDYADALLGVKPGEPVEITVLRDGERLTLTITPTSGSG